jgi:tetratricopeptide (TPR) repeat protein
MRIRFRPFILLLLPLLCLGAYLFYRLPPIYDRLNPRLELLRAQIKYAIDPPEQALFVPQSVLTPGAQASPQRERSPVSPQPLPAQDTPISASITPTTTPTQPGATEPPLPSPTPTLTPTALPSVIRLDGVKYEDQHNRWNYCGPANLSMALTFWGWDGNRDVVAAYVKPNPDAIEDKNVMPYEMQDFVQTQTAGLGALVRLGGDIDLVKRLVASGFPVLAEKGYYEYDYNGKLGWMGHYQFVTGYDDEKAVLIVQDTYNDGPNFEISYQDFLTGWRSFNFLFLVTYPLEREVELLTQLGEWSDPEWAARRALERAKQEAETLDGVNQYFAWFNIGTSHVNLQEYVDAAYAYDFAFQLYAGLPEDTNPPYRMMWYQTGPYWAYYYSGRYQDVINLADTTLYETVSEPVLEESFYWRAMARYAIGDSQGALDDFRTSLELHPGFAATLYMLEQLGWNP